MEKVFKKFEGKKINVQFIDSMGMIVTKNGWLEISDKWAYLYDLEGESGQDYTVAIYLSKNNVITIATI